MPSVTQCSRRPTAALSTFALLALVVVYASCGQEAPSGPSDPGQPAFKGKPPPESITVDDFEPDSASQGELFPMTVRGSGFGNGAKLVFVLDGEDVTTISTTTTSVTDTELIADVEIGLEAVVSDEYQVAVTLRGSRGVGTESFKVKVGPQADIPLSITIADSPYGLVSDGNGAYVDGEDPDLSAVIQSSGHLAFWTRLSARAIRVYLGDPIGSYDPSLMPTHALDEGVHAWLVTQDTDTESPTTPTNPKGFLKPTLTPLPFYVVWNAEGTTWSLNYGSTCEAENGIWDQPGDFVEVQEIPGGWTLEAASRPAEGNVWLCRMVERRGKEKKDHPSPWTTVGRFDVSTHMTLDKLSGP